MLKNHKTISAAKVSAVASAVAIPLILYAYSTGPDPRYTGAPGDSPLACATSGCHAGPPNAPGLGVNGGPGKVAITFPGALTYVPGAKQRLIVTVTDAGQRVFGFQATARLASNLSAGQAGSFSNADATTQILCDDGSLLRTNGACRAGQTVQFIEHTLAGSRNSFNIDWTPPDTNVGDVRIYVAGNAANGNGLSDAGDHIYTANYTLTADTGGGSGGGNAPTISSNGVVDAFNFASGIASNTWTAIFGTNLAAAVKTWDDAVVGTTLPTTVGGVSVTVNNKPATVNYVSDKLINILTPVDLGTGTMSVVVNNNGVASAPVTVTAGNVKPAFYTPFADATGKQYVSAVALDGTYVGKVGVDPRVTRGARPGEILQVYGTGFGPTNPTVVATEIVIGAPAVTIPVTIRFGQTVASVGGTGNLVFAGLYQFNVTVPDVDDGEYQLLADQGGITSSSNVYIVVSR